MWWVNRFGNITGPYSDEQMRRGIRNNQFTRLNKISCDRQDWIRLDQSEFWKSERAATKPLDLPTGTIVRKIGSVAGGVFVESDEQPLSETANGQVEAETENKPEPVDSSELRVAEQNGLVQNKIVAVVAASAAVVVIAVVIMVAFVVGGSRRGIPDMQPSASDSPKGVVEIKDKQEGRRMDFEVVKRNVAIIHTKDGNGTGFLLKMGAKAYLVTNEHVIRGSSKPEAVKIDGARVNLGTLSLAKDRDLARYEVSGVSDCLELSDVLPNNNDEIWVYGNSMGDDVVTSLRGFVTGVGSRILKVNAEIVGGNSGSPIIGMDGRVLAVASYLRAGNGGRDWTTKGTSFDEVRRFGIRFTNIEWQVVDQEEFHSECRKMAAVNTYWEFLVPYLICQNVSEERYATLKLEHKDVDGRCFDGNDHGFQEMLMALSKSYAGQGKIWKRWGNLLKERESLIARLNEAIGDGSLTRENAENALKEFDEQKIGDNWDRVKARHRDFNAKRKEALILLRSFLRDEKWDDPMIRGGYGDDNRQGCVDWYFDGIKYFLEQNAQELKDLNKALRSLEKGDDDDED